MDSTDRNDPDNVLDMIRPFDPLSHEAEEEYDGVVRRLNQIRIRRARRRREFERLERQFVENDLTVQSGPRRGRPLSARGRKQRLSKLVELGGELRQATEEERFAVRTLARMNAALDRWARETYGP